MVERNWAGNVEYRSATVDRPTTVDELREMVVRSPRIHVLGTRHSFNEIADGDLLISLDALPDDVVVDTAAGTVELNPAMTYGRLAPMLHERGLALHNLASLPHISVGGAIATGTHGSGDRFGNLATAVCAIDILRSDGEIVHLERGDTDFDGAVVGLGSAWCRRPRSARCRAGVRDRPARLRRAGVGRAGSALRRDHGAPATASACSRRGRSHVDQVWVKQRLPSDTHRHVRWAPDQPPSTSIRSPACRPRTARHNSACQGCGRTGCRTSRWASLRAPVTSCSPSCCCRAARRSTRSRSCAGRRRDGTASADQRDPHGRRRHVVDEPAVRT